MDLYLEEKGIRSTIDLYAHYADTRQAQKQASLFAKDSIFRVFTEGEEKSAAQTFTTVEEYLAVFENLNRYETTFHFNGQSMIDLDETKETATAETYTLAFHKIKVDGKASLMNVGIRYDDTLIKEEGRWKFKVRNLHIRFIDTNDDLHSEQI